MVKAIDTPDSAAKETLMVLLVVSITFKNIMSSTIP
jgi:hypothetical protein